MPASPQMSPRSAQPNSDAVPSGNRKERKRLERERTADPVSLAQPDAGTEKKEKKRKAHQITETETSGIDAEHKRKENKKKKEADQVTETETADVSGMPDSVDWAGRTRNERKLEKEKKRQKKLAKLDEEAKAALKAELDEKESRERANKALKAKGKLTKKQKYLAAKAAKKAQAQAGRKDVKAPFKLGEALAAAKVDKLDPKAISCFMTGLPYLATEKHISNHFADVGPCTVQLLKDKLTDRSNGTGFVNFTTAEEALQASTYNGTKIQGRWINVRLCEPRDTGGRTANNEPGEKPSGCLSVVIKHDKSISERSLRRFFVDCDVVNVSCLKDRDTGELRGTSFLDFEDTSMVDKAVKKNGQTIKGLAIHVRYKMEKKPEEAQGESGGRVAAHNRAPPVPAPTGKVTTFDDSDAE